MFRKLLVANRGEIAIRAFRAAYELELATVAVFPYEDRNSLHRAKADESYMIGERGHPVRAYLSVDEVIAAARRSGADAVYPGYGFLSENPDLAQACADAGITFVGPPPEVLHLTGDKSRAIAAAREAGLPVLGSSAPSAEIDELVAAADELGFPLFVKAVAGGGGRGMRRVDEPGQLRESVAAAMREAQAAFGDATVFLERAVVNPRHIEVQILADASGGVVHLYERDCSLQRRHQKVIEIAPAQNLDPGVRDRICADAVAFARHIGYVNAGTVEFLLDERGQHVFIEMNPRIQVEHTVTEEVTGRDLVIAQLRIAAGKTLSEMDLRAGADPCRRRRAAVPGHHRGPGQRLPPGHGRDQRLPLAGRPGCPARRGHARRGRGQPALRLDAGQAHLQQPHLRERRPPGPAGRRRVPHPRRRDEPAVPRRGARRPRLPRRAGSPRASSTSGRTCWRAAARPTAAPGSSPTSPRRR